MVYLITSVVIFILSFTSLALKMLLKDLYKLKSFEAIMVSIITSNIMYGVYLLIVFLANLTYKNNLFLLEEEWKSSFSCSIPFVLATHLQFTSPILISILSFSRIMVVILPLNTKIKDTKLVVSWIMTIISIVSVLVVGFLIFLLIFYGNMPKFCFPTTDKTSSKPLMRIVTWLIVIFQIVSSLFVSTVYLTLVKKLVHSQESFQDQIFRKQSNIPTHNSHCRSYHFCYSLLGS